MKKILPLYVLVFLLGFWPFVESARTLMSGVAYTDIANTFTANQLVSKTRPEFQLQHTGGNIGRFFQYISGATDIAHNLAYDGSNFNLDNTSDPGGLLEFGGSTMAYYIASAGTNPRTLSQVFKASSSGVFEHGRSTAIGEWIQVTYSAANFAGDVGGSAWTVDSGDQIGYAYTLIGKTLILSFTLNGTSVSGSPNRLLIKIPDGFIAAHQSTTTARVFDNGTERYGILDCTVGATQVRVQPVSFATAATVTYATSTNATSVQGTITLEIQ